MLSSCDQSMLVLTPMPPYCLPPMVSFFGVNNGHHTAQLDHVLNVVKAVLWGKAILADNVLAVDFGLLVIGLFRLLRLRGQQHADACQQKADCQVDQCKLKTSYTLSADRAVAC